jgi:hypothetical protein
MKFLIYLYYRLYEFSYEEKKRNKLIHALFMYHGYVYTCFIMFIIVWTDRIFDFKITSFMKDESMVMRRFLYIPLIIFPFSLLTFIFYKLKKQYFWQTFNSFLDETPEQKKIGIIKSRLFYLIFIALIILGLVL